MLECQDGDDDEEAWDMSSSISSSDSEFHHCRYFPSLLPMLLFHVWYIDTDDCYQCFCSIYDIYLWYLLLILKYSKIFFFRWLIGGGGGRCCQTNVSNVSKQQIRWPQCVQKKENDRSRNDGPCSNKRASVARSEWCLSGWIIQVRSSSMFVECSKKLMHIWTLFPDHFFHLFFQQNTVVRPIMFGKNVRWCFGEISAGQQHSHWKKSNQVHPRHRYWYLASNTNLHLCHMLCHLWYFFWTIVIFFWQLPFRFFLRSPLVPHMLCHYVVPLVIFFLNNCDIFLMWCFFTIATPFFASALASRLHMLRSLTLFGDQLRLHKHRVDAKINSTMLLQVLQLRQ